MLDSSMIQDLLTITCAGIESVEAYIQEYVIPPPVTGPRKSRVRTQKLATFTKEPNQKKAKNAMTSKVVVVPYPLAIADINGNMRTSQKSKF